MGNGTFQIWDFKGGAADGVGLRGQKRDEENGGIAEGVEVKGCSRMTAKMGRTLLKGTFPLIPTFSLREKE